MIPPCGCQAWLSASRADFRERDRIKGRITRWSAKIEKMQLLERSALLAALQDFLAVTVEDAGDIDKENDAIQAAPPQTQ